MLHDPSPAQHSFHMSSAWALSSRTLRSDLQRSPATSSFLLILRILHVTRSGETAF